MSEKKIGQLDSVVQLYEEFGSYTKVARIVGLSRQRIHQIVCNYNNTGVRGRKELYTRDLCEVCLERKAKHGHHKDFNNENDTAENMLEVCVPCHKKIHSARLRSLSPSQCSICKREFRVGLKKFAIKECLCRTCYKKIHNSH